MANKSNRDEVLETIAKHGNVTHEQLLAADCIDDLMEPMVVIEVVFELEEKYGMEIDDNDVLAIETVDDLVLCVLQRLAAAA